jgi:hypothetical protein
VATEGDIVIHKAVLANYHDTKDDLFRLMSPTRLYQTYSGVYNFNTITKIIDGYKPIRVISYCKGMHASTIVKIIFSFQIRKYRLRIHRALIIDSPRTTITTMILRFYLLESSNFESK